ncbi:MAG: hypothetical protein NVSMB19_07290 [Vulcanimicrobiaceae bacterium]
MTPGGKTGVLESATRARPELYWNVDLALRLQSIAGGSASIFEDLARGHVGSTLFEIFSTEDADHVAIKAHRRALAGEAVGYEIEYDGRHYRSCVRPVFDGTGSIVGATGVSIDASAEVELLQSLRRAEETLALAQEAAHLGSWTRDGCDGRVAWSNELYKLCGLPVGEPSPTMELLLQYVHPDDRLALEAALDVACEERGGYALDARLVRADGVERWMHHRGNATLDPSGAIRIIGTVLDIETRKAAEVGVARREHYDDVTGLPNRKLLFDRMQQMLLAHSSVAPIAVLFVDLDRYKSINDTLGQAAGDALLGESVPRMIASVGEGRTIARWGADEFAVLLGDVGSVDEAARVAERVVATFALPFEIDGLEVYSTASVGIALFPDDGETPEELMRSASAAQQHARGNGNGSFRFYAPATHATAIERLDFEHRLRRAVETEAMTLHYQPIVDRFERPIAVEALLRWHDDRFGSIPPDRFIALSEELGLIVPLGRWVVREALAQLARWDAAGLPPLRLALNISGRQLGDPGLAMVVARGMDAWGLLPGRIELEITESVIMEDVRVARRAVGELKELGVRVALDDFGTGYSSLSYLKHFRVDALKIDRAFVMDLPQDRGDAAIVSAVVALGHAMDLTVVAEGVETSEQAALVRKLGCDELQGFYYSKALPAADFERVIRAWSGSVRTR